MGAENLSPQVPSASSIATPDWVEGKSGMLNAVPTHWALCQGFLHAAVAKSMAIY